MLDVGRNVKTSERNVETNNFDRKGGCARNCRIVLFNGLGTTNLLQTIDQQLAVVGQLCNNSLDRRSITWTMDRYFIAAAEMHGHYRRGALEKRATRNYKTQLISLLSLVSVLYFRSGHSIAHVQAHSTAK